MSNKKITKEDIGKVKDALEGVLGSENEAFNMMEALSSLLAMSEENFRLVAPGIMESYKQTLNNPNDKVALALAINASGSHAEDLTASFETLREEIDKMTTISQRKRDFIKEMVGTICNAISDTEGIAKKTITIPIELCHEKAFIPQYARIGDSGLDIFALEDITIHPGETVLVPTGIKVALPPGFEFQIRPKSGRALKTKLRVANSPATVDSSYRDELKVIIENVEAPIKEITYEFDETTHRPIITSILHGGDFFIGKGEKFAQLVLMEVPKAAFYRVENVMEIGENRGGGFGSTGLK